MNVKAKFLQGVLGVDGSRALRKATDRDSRLGAVVLPRTILGWLNFIGNYEYEGQLPNVDNSYIQLSKNEDSTFDGSIDIEGYVYDFVKSDIYHVASAIALALGETSVNTDSNVRDMVLVKLGQSIDILAKAQEIARTIDSKLKIDKDDIEKVELKAQPQQPIEPQSQLKPAINQESALKLPGHKLKSVKISSMKLSRSESEIKCSFCGGHQFEDYKFNGCLCFADLAKNVKTTAYSDGYVLDFKPGFDTEAYIVISKYFRG